ncbi:MAG: AAA family ATPase [Pseudomonadales bacterium]|nr:AAA family ATPase [Pseudomonadales bacterium]
MYQDHFGFNQEPFSIAPDPSFLYLSASHNEALAHLLYGFSNGGFVLITGEVGTGKTTLLRNLLDKTPADIDVAFILNPRLTVKELLETLCDELGIVRPDGEPDSVKRYIDILNRHLLETHRAARSTVMIIDEAQNLTPAVLEQIRLLTNLETNDKKLLRIILLGQPELQEMLDRTELRQLSQRITARYHLSVLGKEESLEYIRHRLTRAGGNPNIFTDRAMSALFRRSKGTPRLINIIADRALLGAYVESAYQVTPTHVRLAAKEVLGGSARFQLNPFWYSTTAVVLIILGVVALINFTSVKPDGATDAAPSSITRPQQISEPPQPESPTITHAAPISQLQEKPQATAVAEPGVPAPVTLSPITRPDFSGYSLQRMAFAKLFERWGTDYNVDGNPVPCDFAPKAGLQCMRRSGGWTEINNLAAPVIVELWDDEPSPYYGALVQREGDRYTLLVGNDSFEIRPRDLRDAWFGVYILLWQTPPSYRGSLKQGDQHTTVAWLREKLNLLQPDLSLGSSDRFDEELLQVVRRFQEQEDLVADGVVGPLTWIRLADRLQLPAPKLDG